MYNRKLKIWKKTLEDISMLFQHLWQKNVSEFDRNPTLTKTQKLLKCLPFFIFNPYTTNKFVFFRTIWQENETRNTDHIPHIPEGLTICAFYHLTNFVHSPPKETFDQQSRKLTKERESNSNGQELTIMVWKNYQNIACGSGSAHIPRHEG